MTEEQATTIELLCEVARRARENGDRRTMLWAQDELAGVAAQVHRHRTGAQARERPGPRGSRARTWVP